MTEARSIAVPGGRLGWLIAGGVVGLALAVAFGSSLAPRQIVAQSDPTTPEHTISVSGTGRVTLSPDVADISVGVQVTATKVKDARAQAATKMTAVIAALKAAGIADKDIQTSNVSLSPVYDYGANANPPRVTGYQVANTVTATVRDLDKVSDALDGAMAAGATSIGGINFRVDNQTAPAAQARDLAMKDAKVKADALAKAAGVSITGVASISEQVTTPPQPIRYDLAAGSAAAPEKATPVQTGTNEIDIVVSVVYLID